MGKVADRKSQSVIKEDLVPNRAEFNGLNCTFENFQRSPANEIAYQSARMVAEDPGRFNPLYLCGPSSAGKTHLARAIVAHMRALGQCGEVFYATGRDFCRELSARTRLSTRATLGKSLEQAVLLILDGVDVFHGWRRSEQELFNILKVRADGGRQTVLIARCYPGAIKDIADPLRSRFSQGLVALMRAFQSETAITQSRPLTPGTVVETVAAHYALRAKDLRGLGCARQIVLPRHMAMLLMRLLCRDAAGQPVSYPQIGQALGGKDHSTVITACRNLATRALVNPILLETLTVIAADLGMVLPPRENWPRSKQHA